MNGARRRRLHTPSRRAAWGLVGPVAVMVVPAIVAFILASDTAGPDLSHLVPIASQTNDYRLLGWEDLRRSNNALIVSAVPSGTKLCALGYMMEGDLPVRGGQRIRSFVLLPEAGNNLHPEERFGDEMIDVELQSGNEVSFSRRSLIWFGGRCEACRGMPPAVTPSTSWKMLEPSRPPRALFQSTSGEIFRTAVGDGSFQSMKAAH